MYMNYFCGKKRPNGEYFVFLSDDSPKILDDFVYDLHTELGKGLPNDWIYEQLGEAFYAFEKDKIELDDLCLEADIYTYDLLDWCKDFHEFIDESNDEIGRPATFINEISQANWYLKDMIHRRVHDFLEQNPYSEADEEEEEALAG